MEKSLDIIAILMPTVAKTFPQIYDMVRKSVDGRKKIDQSVVFSLAQLEMFAQMNDKIFSLEGVLRKHDDDMRKTADGVVNLTKDVRDIVESIKIKI